MSHYLSLGLAITFEIIGTSFLKQTEEFTRFWPSAIVLLTYGCAFYMLTLTIRTMPVGIAYAIWCGLGIVAISLIGLIAFKQYLDAPAVIGLALIVSGVVVINLFSNTVSH